jgi:hypothetical protein
LVPQEFAPLSEQPWCGDDAIMFTGTFVHVPTLPGTLQA